MGLFDSLRKAFGGQDDSRNAAQAPTPARMATPQVASADAVIEAPTREKALELLGRITGQDELKRVAEGAWRCNEARIAAIERIDDQTFLAQCAIKDQVIPVKMRAIDRIEDPTLLLDVWRRERPTPAWRDVALRAETRAAQLIEQIADQDALAKFAVCDSTPCRRAATERLEDKKLLARIALGEAGAPADVWQRRLAIAKIDDRRVLRKVLEKRDPWDDDYKSAEARLEELDEQDEPEE